MSRRRVRRRTEKTHRHSQPVEEFFAAPKVVVREAERVERIAYTRTQAAQALGVSRSTFNRRVLPYIETIEMPWGLKLIPVDSLERLLSEQRRQPREQHQVLPRGRRPAVSAELLNRIRAERAAGNSLSQIARDLNNAGTPTAQGGKQWWPSTVKAVLVRPDPPKSADPNRRLPIRRHHDLEPDIEFGNGA